MAHSVEMEQVRLKALIDETEGDKVHPVVVVRPSFKPRGTAEQAWRSGETEEEMIAKKMKDLQMKAQLKDKNKGDPAWKHKEKERQEQLEKEKHLQSILQHPLASPKKNTEGEADWKGLEEKSSSQSQPTTPVHTPVKAEPYSHSQPTTPVFHADAEEDRQATRKREEARLRAHYLAVHEDRNS
jgi:hypothetical protein